MSERACSCCDSIIHKSRNISFYIAHGREEALRDSESVPRDVGHLVRDKAEVEGDELLGGQRPGARERVANVVCGGIHEGSPVRVLRDVVEDALEAVSIVVGVCFASESAEPGGGCV